MSKKTVDYSTQSNWERACLVEQIFVRYIRMKDLLAKIDYCRQYSKIAAEPWCMLITGWTGAGKTKLGEKYAEDFPRQYTEEGLIAPVLYARVPSRANDKSLPKILLKSLKDPFAEKGDRINLTLRLYEFIEKCGVELIILDEFQHFVDWDSLKILQSVSDWLKNLIDETHKPVVLIGMPYSDVVLNALGNSQLSRRFSQRLKLDYFNWETKEQKQEFRGFLKMLDEQLPLNELSGFSSPTMAYRFYCGTNGAVGYVMKIVRRAAVIALGHGRENVNLEDLAQAFDEKVQAEDPKRMNPFSADPACLEIKPFEFRIPELKATGSRIRGKKEVLTVSDVLR